MINKNISVCAAHENDAAIIAEFGAKSFKETFDEFNTAEDMQMYIAANFSVQKIKEELNTVANYYLAYENGNLAGYMKFEKSNKPFCVENENTIEIGRFYVDTKLIGKGYGAALMKFTIDKAKSLGHKSIWLGVWEKNYRAIEFYNKWGFAEVGSHDFILGKDIQTDLIMELTLR